jgi:hypothetical protein
MGFFRGFGQSDNEPEHDEPSGAGDAGQTDSLARIEAGGIPLEAATGAAVSPLELERQ